MGENTRDYRQTDVARKRSWHGLKKYAKRVLALRIPHFLLRRSLRFAPEMRRSGRLPAPASLKEVQGHVQGARFVMLRPDRCIVAKELYWGGGTRPRPEDGFAMDLFATVVRRADVMLDIGAYTGLFTLLSTAVNPDLEAHAFEIVPDVYGALFDNCVRNGVLHRVTLHHVGVGAPEAEMRVPADSVDSALPDFYSRRLRFDSGVLVRFRSLDSFATSLPPDARVVVKVDVEGTECDVFRHGQEFLGAFHPDILCEVLAGVADAAELERVLAPHGYRFYLVREADLLPARSIEPNARFRDWFFTARGPDELTELGIAVDGASARPAIVP